MRITGIRLTRNFRKFAARRIRIYIYIYEYVGNGVRIFVCDFVFYPLYLDVIAYLRVGGL